MSCCSSPLLHRPPSETLPACQTKTRGRHLLATDTRQAYASSMSNINTGQMCKQPVRKQSRAVPLRLPGGPAVSVAAALPATPLPALGACHRQSGGSGHLRRHHPLVEPQLGRCTGRLAGDMWDRCEQDVMMMAVLWRLMQQQLLLSRRVRLQWLRSVCCWSMHPAGCDSQAALVRCAVTLKTVIAPLNHAAETLMHAAGIRMSAAGSQTTVAGIQRSTVEKLVHCLYAAALTQ